MPSKRQKQHQHHSSGINYKSVALASGEFNHDDVDDDISYSSRRDSNEAIATPTKSGSRSHRSNTPATMDSVSTNSAKMSKYKELAIIYFLAEFFGTFMLVIIGDGAIAAYVVTRNKVEVFVVCLGFGVGAMVATFLAGKISGAHINPAATLAFALEGSVQWKYVPVYLLGQYAGGFAAATVLLVNYAEGIAYIDGGTRSAFGAFNSTGHIFATYPAPYLSNWGGVLDQIIGTGVLLFSISAVTDRANSGLEARHQPLIIALVIALVCVAFSANCGAIFNPARDLSPRLVTAIFGYHLEPFRPLSGHYWWLSGVVGPHIGAVLGVFAYKLFIGRSLYIKQKLDSSHQHKNDTQLHKSKIHDNAQSPIHDLHHESESTTKFSTSLQAL
ncbi:Aquaporin-7 [Fragariocoptes setiger]|uniref:Aquaporin-7 n=1 Tax=Fragariocoptes setiger TaxID=1670756 RepID=A0ABQ7S8Q0_9ACAR|nr:Aquaporin-7 [Fragariocoptes setiger]